MNRNILIEDLKAEIANNSYRETPMTLTKVVCVDDVYETIDEFKNDLLQNVSYSVAQQYAEFCVRCDREKLPLIKIEDYLKQL